MYEYYICLQPADLSVTNHWTMQVQFEQGMATQDAELGQVPLPQESNELAFSFRVVLIGVCVCVCVCVCVIPAGTVDDPLPSKEAPAAAAQLAATCIHILQVGLTPSQLAGHS